MRILGIETSCDETAVAYAQYISKKEYIVLKEVVEELYSQASKHNPYGGVYPSLAKREHQIHLPILTKMVLQKIPYTSKVCDAMPSRMKEMVQKESVLYSALQPYIKKQKPNIDAIAVTIGPGLDPALWVGVTWARALALLWDVPLIPVNHMEGHIISAYIERKNGEYRVTKPTFPLLALLVSGGHTELVVSNKLSEYVKIGQTVDDAVGEAFDKVARLLGLSYPGGPAISKLATQARREKLFDASIQFPRPMIKHNSYNFSYAGLKTAVRIYIEKNNILDEKRKKVVAREFEDAAIAPLIQKTKRAIQEYKPKSLIVGGGVSANTHLRQSIATMVAEQYPTIICRIPQVNLATDNALMITTTAYITKGATQPTKSVMAKPNLSL